MTLYLKDVATAELEPLAPYFDDDNLLTIFDSFFVPMQWDSVVVRDKNETEHVFVGETFVQGPFKDMEIVLKELWTAYDEVGNRIQLDQQMVMEQRLEAKLIKGEDVAVYETCMSDGNRVNMRVSRNFELPSVRLEARSANDDWEKMDGAGKVATLIYDAVRHNGELGISFYTPEKGVCILKTKLSESTFRVDRNIINLELDNKFCSFEAVRVVRECGEVDNSAMQKTARARKKVPRVATKQARIHFGGKRLRKFGEQSEDSDSEEASDDEPSKKQKTGPIPPYLICKLTGEPFDNPMMLSSGETVEESLVASIKFCPFTGEEITGVKPHTLLRQIMKDLFSGRLTYKE